MADTETLDRLYLEWSQFTSARTQRETALWSALYGLLRLHEHHKDREHWVGRMNAGDKSAFAIVRAIDAIEAVRSPTHV